LRSADDDVPVGICTTNVMLAVDCGVDDGAVAGVRDRAEPEHADRTDAAASAARMARVRAVPNVTSRSLR
jgi:hypothetical protein